MAWLSRDCVLTLEPLSWDVRTDRDKLFGISFSTKRNVLGVEPKIKRRPSSRWTRQNLPLVLLKDGMLYRVERKGEGDSIFKTAVTVFFVQHGFEICETFQKQESHVRNLPAHSQRYIFDFEIELNEKKKI